METNEKPEINKLANKKTQHNEIKVKSHNWKLVKLEDANLKFSFKILLNVFLFLKRI